MSTRDLASLVAAILLSNLHPTAVDREKLDMVMDLAQRIIRRADAVT